MKVINNNWIEAEALKCGAKEKFIVLKIQDCNKYLTDGEINSLKIMLDGISVCRKHDGKKLDNEYLVINTDEPYVQEIIEILKSNGHWG